MTNSIDLSEMIKRAGGVGAIQAEAFRRGVKITKSTVYKWKRAGVPDRYWPIFVDLAGVNPAQMYEANAAARAA